MTKLQIPDEGEHSSRGELWWPREYGLIVELEDSLVHEEPALDDFM